MFTSLLPRLWPGTDPDDAVEETVLVRLGANELDETVYIDELVEAVDPWRSGLDVWSGKSVCVRRDDAKLLDITGADLRERMR